MVNQMPEIIGFAWIDCVKGTFIFTLFCLLSWLSTVKGSWKSILFFFTFFVRLLSL